MTKLDHANVIGLKEVINDSRSDNLCLVQEFMMGPIMSDEEHNKPLESELVRIYLRCGARSCLRYITASPCTAAVTRPAVLASFNVAVQVESAVCVLCEFYREILRGLEYVHFQNVVHMDIKPANLLLDDNGHAKIGDFGAAIVVPNKATRIAIRQVVIVKV